MLWNVVWVIFIDCVMWFICCVNVVLDFLRVMLMVVVVLLVDFMVVVWIRYCK